MVKKCTDLKTTTFFATFDVYFADFKAPNLAHSVRPLISNSKLALFAQAILHCTKFLLPATVI